MVSKSWSKINMKTFLLDQNYPTEYMNKVFFFNVDS